METPTDLVKFVRPGEGKRLWVTDELVTFVASADDTGGTYSLTDSTVPPQGGPPPHVHHREDEAFWILEGELEVTVGEKRFIARAGAYIHLPRGVPHAYRNVGAEPARFLTLMVPAGLEKFFEEVGMPVGDAPTPPALSDEDIATLVAVASRYGVDILEPDEP